MSVSTTQRITAPAAPGPSSIGTAAARRRLPGGLVTFMFTDLEGSTRLLQALGTDVYRDALDRHHVLLRERVERSRGVALETFGDALFAAFADPAAALRAGAEIQRALAAEPWPGSARFAVRIGLHRGPAEPRDDDYVALAVHETARIAASAHGGQVVVSAAVRQATLSEHDGLELVPLGEHMLKDFDEPVELHQLAGAGLERDFPPLKAPRRRHRNLRLPATALLGRPAAGRRSRRSRSQPCCAPPRS